MKSLLTLINTAIFTFPAYTTHDKKVGYYFDPLLPLEVQMKKNMFTISHNNHIIFCRKLFFSEKCFFLSFYIFPKSHWNEIMFPAPGYRFIILSGQGTNPDSISWKYLSWP